MHAGERERAREAEERGEGSGAGPGREKRKKERQQMQSWAAPTEGLEVLRSRARKKRRETRADPKKKEEEEGEKQEEERGGPDKNPQTATPKPQPPKNPAAFSPPKSRNEAPKQQKQFHENAPTQNQSSLPKTLRKRDPKKSRTQKSEAKMERTFCHRVFGVKTRQFSGKIFFQTNPPTPEPELFTKNPLPKKAKTDRTLENRQSGRDSLTKELSDQNGQHLPLNPIKTQTLCGVEGSFRLGVLSDILGILGAALGLRQSIRGANALYKL